MTNEAFARVKINALLAAQGWDTLDTNAVRFEVQLPKYSRRMKPGPLVAAIRLLQPH